MTENWWLKNEQESEHNKNEKTSATSHLQDIETQLNTKNNDTRL